MRARPASSKASGKSDTPRVNRQEEGYYRSNYRSASWCFKYRKAIAGQGDTQVWRANSNRTAGIYFSSMPHKIRHYLKYGYTSLPSPTPHLPPFGQNARPAAICSSALRPGRNARLSAAPLARRTDLPPPAWAVRPSPAPLRHGRASAARPG